MTTDTIEKDDVPAALQAFIDQGATLARGGEWNPNIKLDNKEGEPGAWMMGTFVSIRDQKYTYGGEDKIGKIATFIFQGSSEPVNRIKGAGLFEPIPMEKVIDCPIDMWVDGQLLFVLMALATGDKVGILYQGKKEVEGYAQPLHQWKVWKMDSGLAKTA